MVILWKEDFVSFFLLATPPVRCWGEQLILNKNPCLKAAQVRSLLSTVFKTFFTNFSWYCHGKFFIWVNYWSFFFVYIDYALHIFTQKEICARQIRRPLKANQQNCFEIKKSRRHYIIIFAVWDVAPSGWSIGNSTHSELLINKCNYGLYVRTYFTFEMGQQH